jgi:hypothetical protein
MARLLEPRLFVCVLAGLKALLSGLNFGDWKYPLWHRRLKGFARSGTPSGCHPIHALGDADNSI